MHFLKFFWLKIINFKLLKLVNHKLKWGGTDFNIFTKISARLSIMTSISTTFNWSLKNQRSQILSYSKTSIHFFKGTHWKISNLITKIYFYVDFVNIYFIFCSLSWRKLNGYLFGASKIFIVGIFSSSCL